MAVNLTNILKLIQKKAAVVDTNTSTQDLIDLFKAAKLADGSLVVEADSAGALPDIASSTGTLVFQKDVGTLKLNNGVWDTLGVEAVEAALPTQAQGSVSGYTSAGFFGTKNVIDKFSFAADGNATDVGDLTQARYASAGQSSTVSGYTSGGSLWPASLQNTIDKFPFASDANATDVGDLTLVNYTATGQSSTTSGYTSGGRTNPLGAQTFVNVIDKFPFAADGNATDVGDITLGTGRYGPAGQSSDVSGYTSQGYFTSGFSNVIDKFSFAADGNATDVGDLTRVAVYATGTNSIESGYTSGGSGPAFTNIIDKFPFASDANATDVGDLTTVKRQAAGQSSGASGYSSGGKVPAQSNIIDKFPFASDGNATDVGDLTVGRYSAAGQQV